MLGHSTLDQGVTYNNIEVPWRPTRLLLEQVRGFVIYTWVFLAVGGQM